MPWSRIFLKWFNLAWQFTTGAHMDRTFLCGFRLVQGLCGSSEPQGSLTYPTDGDGKWEVGFDMVCHWDFAMETCCVPLHVFCPAPVCAIPFLMTVFYEQHLQGSVGQFTCVWGSRLSLHVYPSHLNPLRWYFIFPRWWLGISTYIPGDYDEAHPPRNRHNWPW